MIKLGQIGQVLEIQCVTMGVREFDFEIEIEEGFEFAFLGSRVDLFLDFGVWV